MNLLLHFLYNQKPALALRSIGNEAHAVVLALAALLGWTCHLAAGTFMPDRRSSGLAALGAIAAAIAMACIALLAGAESKLMAGAALGWFLLSLALVDMTTFRLPDALTLPLICLGLVAVATGFAGRSLASGFNWPTVADHCLGAAAGYGALATVAVLFRKARGQEGLGMGDAKLAAAAGAWLGVLALPTVVLVACGLAFAWVIVRWVRQGRASLQRPLPFGPPLAAATWLCWAITPS